MVEKGLAYMLMDVTDTFVAYRDSVVNWLIM